MLENKSKNETVFGEVGAGMSKPTKSEKDELNKYLLDDEAYHSTFDDLLEAKLMLLDPEWMKAMTELYNKSGCDRWCA